MSHAKFVWAVSKELAQFFHVKRFQTRHTKGYPPWITIFVTMYFYEMFSIIVFFVPFWVFHNFTRFRWNVPWKLLVMLCQSFVCEISLGKLSLCCVVNHHPAFPEQSALSMGFTPHVGLLSVVSLLFRGNVEVFGACRGGWQTATERGSFLYCLCYPLLAFRAISSFHSLPLGDVGNIMMSLILPTGACVRH